MKIFKVGTRQSLLAITQTQQIVELLKMKCSEQQVPVQFLLQPIVTRGDREVNVALSKVGGKGLFVKEIEQALFDGEIDFAVHSMKDMPYAMPDGLTIAAIPQREDARDCLVMQNYSSLEQLPAGSIIGTSALRRASQLLHVRADCVMKAIRGNVDSRLRKLESAQFDAIVLAAAGMHRLGWRNRITCYLPLEVCMPAVGQGALCIQCRSGDSRVLELLRMLQHEPTALALHAERTLLGQLNGSCQVPIGAYATIIEAPASDLLSIDASNSHSNEQSAALAHRASDSPSSSGSTKPLLMLTGMVASLDGKTILRESSTGCDPQQLGIEVAHRLRARGADEILAIVEDQLHEFR